MSLPTAGKLAEVLDGAWQGRPPEGDWTGVSTDSRAVRPGELFLALSGEQFDGHDFVAAALQAGAAAAVVSRVPAGLPPETPLLLTADTLRAYGRLGQWARQHSAATLLAVTGSTGKTTTKALLGELLSRRGPTLVAPGTENNEIGVPRVLLGLRPEHRFCVLELGMRGRGEIAYLAELARPQIGVITNIGASHLGRLGSREAIAETKAELLAALPPEGRAVLNADDFFFGLLSELAPCPVVSFGLSATAQVRAEAVRQEGLIDVTFDLCVGDIRLPISLPLPGRHNVLNALAAVAAVWAATGDLAGVAEGLALAQGEAMRGQVLVLPGPITVINDAYNANPSSVVAALELLATAAGRKILVFGDMLELGDYAEAEHRRVGELATATGVSWLVTVGPLAALAAPVAAEAGVATTVTQDAPEALAALREGLRPGDTLLVKASRRRALEQVVEGLIHAV